MGRTDRIVGVPQEELDAIENPEPVEFVPRENTQPLPSDSTIDDLEERLKQKQAPKLNKKIDAKSTEDDLFEAAQEAIGSMLEAEDFYTPAMQQRREVVKELFRLIELRQNKKA